MRWLLLGLILLVSSNVRAQDRAQTSGLAVGVGAGFENAGVGGHAMYYFQTRNERWRIAPHAGVGWFGRAAATGGVMALFGRRHRLVIDLMFSPAASQGGTNSSTKVYYGVSINGGYEWMSYGGVAFRTTVGAAYRPAFRGDSDVVFLAWNPVSITYKFW